MKNTNLILGKTSAGKTLGYMFNNIENLINDNKNLFVIDNKEEYYKTYCETLINKGYKTYIINFSDTEKSNGFNPLLLPYKLYKENKKDESVNLLKKISLEIFKNDNAVDPFWQNAASDYFIGITLYIFEKASKEEINFGSILMMISQLESDEQLSEKFEKYLLGLSPLNPIYLSASGTVFAPSETKGGIVSVLRQELNKYMTKENLLSLLCNGEFDLNNMDDKVAIFAVSDSDNKRFINILLDEIIVSNTKFNYILDNIDSLTRIVELEDLLEKAKITDQKVFVISRSVDILKKTYGEFVIHKFEETIEINEGEYDIKSLGNYNVYPQINKENGKYFNYSKLEE